MCLIINNENFLVSPRRPGADEDEKLLKGLFQELGFSVVVKNDLTRERILETVRNFAGKDHSQFDAFVFAILSHGGEDDIILSSDEMIVGFRELMCLFTATHCPSLQAKPKLFFIDACRGESDAIPRSACPREADFLLAFATTPGHKAYQSSRGSWFTRVSFAYINFWFRKLIVRLSIDTFKRNSKSHLFKKAF